MKVKFYKGKTNYVLPILLILVFVWWVCAQPNDPIKDIRVQAHDSPKVKFEKRVKYLERQILEYPDFEIAKKKYGIKKWGESLKADLKNPLVQLPTGECFNLSKLPEPWFVSQLYFNKTKENKDVPIISGSQYQLVDFFDIDVRMRDLQLPFVDMVESNIFIDRLQEYMYVRVSAKPVLFFYARTFDPKDNFIEYKSYVNEELWKPMQHEGVEFHEWKFDWYIFNPRQGNIFILADFANQSILIGKHWSVEADSLAYHTDEGYPVSPSHQLAISPTGLYPANDGYSNRRRSFIRHDTFSKRPPVGFGKRVYSTGYGYQIMFSALSTPHTAEIFSKVDTIMKNIKTECE